MGLKSGDYGAKRQFAERFPDAFARFGDMFELRTKMEASQGICASVVDGNVAMMSAPAAVATYSDFVGWFKAQVEKHIDVSRHVVVVFDEPAFLTAAKREEQARRDASRQKTAPLCSQDLVSWPTNDAFTQKQLEETDIQQLFRCRATRARTIDAVCMAVLELVRKSRIDSRDAASRPTLCFDGIDARGAHRPADEPREAGVVGSDKEFAALLAREVPIGEGDLKLAAVHERLQKLRNGGEERLAKTELVFLVTIDTDSLAIELIQQALKDEREAVDPVGAEQIQTVLVFRERGQKRGPDGESHGSCLCCDVEMLQEHVCEFLVPPRGSKVATPRLRRRAVTLLAASLALAGCDFVELKGLRADFVFEAVRDLAVNQTTLLKVMDNVLCPEPETAIGAVRALKRVITLALGLLSDAPRMQKAFSSVQQCDEFHLLRAVWVACYWSGVEHAATSQFGFPALESPDLAAEPVVEPAVE